MALNLPQFENIHRYGRLLIDIKCSDRLKGACLLSLEKVGADWNIVSWSMNDISVFKDGE